MEGGSLRKNLGSRRKLTQLGGRTKQMQMKTRNSRAVSFAGRQLCTFMIADAPVQPGQLDHAHILTPEQLAERLKVQVSFIYENTRKRAGVRNADPLPCIRMGKYLRFYWPEVEKWLERRQGGRANA